MDMKLGHSGKRSSGKGNCVITAPGNSVAMSKSWTKNEGFSWSQRRKPGKRPGSGSASVDSKSQIGAEPLLPGSSDRTHTHPVHHPQLAQGLSEEDARSGKLRSCHLPGENYYSRRILQEGTLLELGKRQGLEHLDDSGNHVSG